MIANLHPLMSLALRALDHRAYGTCPRGHVLGRHDSTCPECALDALARPSIPVMVLCDCHASPGDPMPDPHCPDCQGRGEIEVAPF